jgi:hypothetical protein
MTGSGLLCDPDGSKPPARDLAKLSDAKPLDARADGGAPWTVVRILDPSAPKQDTTPGADIDKIVVEDANGTTLAEGCPAGAKLDPSPVPHPAQDPADNLPQSGTLGVLDGDATTGVGYVSLGGAALYCDTGKALRKGHAILIWEVHKTAARSGQSDAFSVDLCQTMKGPCLQNRLATDVELNGDQNDHANIVVSVEP